MATVGSIIVNFKSGTADFAKDVGDAGKALEGFGGKGNLLGSLAEGFTLGAGIGAGIEVVKQGFEIAEKAVEQFVEIGKKAVETIVEWTLAATDSAEHIGNLVTSTGLAAETIGTFEQEAKYAGLSSEGADAALLKFSANIGKFASTGQEGSAALAHYGINFKKLADESPEQALRDVADVISHVGNTSTQSYIAVQLFGKAGNQLLPLFQEGAAGIDSAVKKGLDLKNVLSTQDVGKLLVVDEAVDQLGKQFEGVKNTVALAAAPAIASFAKHISDLVPNAATMQRGFTVAFDAVIELGAYAIDTVSHLAGWILQGAADTQFLSASILKMMGEGQAANEAMELGQTLQGWAKQADAINTSKGAATFIAGLHKDIDNEGKHIEQTLKDKSHAGADAFLENMKKVEDTLASMQKEVDTFGKDAGQKKLFDLKSDGANTEQLERGRHLANQLQQLEEHKKVMEEIKRINEEIAGKNGDKSVAQFSSLVAGGATNEDIQLWVKANEQLKEAEDHHKRMEEAKTIWDAARTPLEKYNDEMTKLNELLKHGELNQHQFDEAKGKAKGDLDKADHLDKEAPIIQRRFSFDLPNNSSNDPAKDTADAVKKHLAQYQAEQQQRQDQWQYLHDIAQYTDQTVTF